MSGDSSDELEGGSSDEMGSSGEDDEDGEGGDGEVGRWGYGEAPGGRAHLDVRGSQRAWTVACPTGSPSGISLSFLSVNPANPLVCPPACLSAGPPDGDWRL